MKSRKHEQSSWAWTDGPGSKKEKGMSFKLSFSFDWKFFALCGQYSDLRESRLWVQPALPRNSPQSPTTWLAAPPKGEGIIEVERHDLCKMQICKLQEQTGNSLVTCVRCWKKRFVPYVLLENPKFECINSRSKHSVFTSRVVKAKRTILSPFTNEYRAQATFNGIP